MKLNEVPKKEQSPDMFNRISKTYDLLNRSLSMGIDKIWRKKLTEKIPNGLQNIEVLDLATGTADLAIELAKLPQTQRVIGVDPAEKMLQIGREKIAKKGLSQKVGLESGDALNLSFPEGSFDLVTISFGIRNFPDPRKGLDEIYRVLKPEGKLLILEFGIPSNIMRVPYLFYFRKVLPTIGGLVSSDSSAYKYLNQTVEDFPFAEKFIELMRGSGFEKNQFTSLTMGTCYLYEGTKLEQ